jgi:O-acetyl-ADP-ribose deacetylase (regulator of RNase III)
VGLEERTGDLFAASDVQGLAHGCNCKGVMGKGISVEFRRRWPAMFEEYKRCCAEGSFTLGDVFVWNAGDRTIFNLATQRTWRTKAEPWAIEKSVAKMVEIAETAGLDAVGLPRIGAGLGGLPWKAVERILGAIAEKSPVRLVVFTLPDLGPGQQNA